MRVQRDTIWSIFNRAPVGSGMLRCPSGAISKARSSVLDWPAASLPACLRCWLHQTDARRPS
jgi:hypothetical protein